MLLHFVGTVRAFYASVAKAVHAQARRRDDPAFQPNASMKAASVTLGVILKHNLTATHQVHFDGPCGFGHLSQICLLHAMFVMDVECLDMSTNSTVGCPINVRFVLPE